MPDSEHQPSACEVCGDIRPSHLIQRTRHDVSESVGLDPGSLERIVRHCCDRRGCVEDAEDPDLWQCAPQGYDAWTAAFEAVESLNPDGTDQ